MNETHFVLHPIYLQIPVYLQTKKKAKTLSEPESEPGPQFGCEFPLFYSPF